MKKTKLLLIACITFYNAVQAQKMIEMDFATKSIPTMHVTDIKQGEYYQIKINNINQNLFKISLTSIDTVLSKPQKTPTFGNFDLDAFSKVISGISTLSTTVTQSESYQSFTKTLSSIKEKSFFPALVIAANSGIVDRMEKEKNILLKEKQSVEEIAERIDNLKLEVYKFRLNSFKISNPSSSFNFNQVLIDLEKIRQDISKLKVNSTNEKNSYEAFSKSNKTAIEKDKDLASNDKSIKESYYKLLSSLSEALESISADKANELLSSVVFLENNANNTYTSLPIQLLGEQAKVQISISPREEKYKLQTYYTQIVFPQNIISYTVVGVSFYGTLFLYDKSYSTIKTAITDSTFNYKFKEENVGKTELGIAALLRQGKKWNDDNDFGGHFSIGAGVSISNKIKPRVLFGGGLSFGNKHMLALDLGGIVGYVDRLSKTIDLSNSYLEKPETITVSKLGIGVFTSFGYMYQF